MDTIDDLSLGNILSYLNNPKDWHSCFLTNRQFYHISNIVFDPIEYDGAALIFAVAKNHIKKVEELLNDNRVTVNVREGYAIRIAIRNGYDEIFKMLLVHPTTKPYGNNNILIMDTIKYKRNQYFDILLKDKRINPFDCNGYGIKKAIYNDNMYVFKIYICLTNYILNEIIIRESNSGNHHRSESKSKYNFLENEHIYNNKWKKDIFKYFNDGLEIAIREKRWEMIKMIIDLDCIMDYSDLYKQIMILATNKKLFLGGYFSMYINRNKKLNSDEIVEIEHILTKLLNKPNWVIPNEDVDIIDSTTKTFYACNFSEKFIMFYLDNGKVSNFINVIQYAILACALRNGYENVIIYVYNNYEFLEEEIIARYDSIIISLTEACLNDKDAAIEIFVTHFLDFYFHEPKLYYELIETMIRHKKCNGIVDKIAKNISLTEQIKYNKSLNIHGLQNVNLNEMLVENVSGTLTILFMGIKDVNIELIKFCIAKLKNKISERTAATLIANCDDENCRKILSDEFNRIEFSKLNYYTMVDKIVNDFENMKVVHFSFAKENFNFDRRLRNFILSCAGYGIPSDIADFLDQIKKTIFEFMDAYLVMDNILDIEECVVDLINKVNLTYESKLKKYGIFNQSLKLILNRINNKNFYQLLTELINIVMHKKHIHHFLLSEAISLNLVNITKYIIKYNIENRTTIRLWMSHIEQNTRLVWYLLKKMKITPIIYLKKIIDHIFKTNNNDVLKEIASNNKFNPLQNENDDMTQFDKMLCRFIKMEFYDLVIQSAKNKVHFFIEYLLEIAYKYNINIYKSALFLVKKYNVIQHININFSYDDIDEETLIGYKIYQEILVPGIEENDISVIDRFIQCEQIDDLIWKYNVVDLILSRGNSDLLIPLFIANKVDITIYEYEYNGCIKNYTVNTPFKYNLNDYDETLIFSDLRNTLVDYSKNGTKAISDASPFDNILTNGFYDPKTIGDIKYMDKMVYMDLCENCV